MLVEAPVAINSIMLDIIQGIMEMAPPETPVPEVEVEENIDIKI